MLGDIVNCCRGHPAVRESGEGEQTDLEIADVLTKFVPLSKLMAYPRLEPHDADCAAKLKKRTLTNLYNERPAWLDLAHKKLDVAVAAGTAGQLTSQRSKFWSGFLH